MDGEVQPIVPFEAVVMPPREEPTAPWMRHVAPDVKTNALGEPRLFVIIMDDAQTPFDPNMASSAKKLARAIVEHQSPSDLAAVVFTKNNKGAQDFTSDRALLMTAIDSFRPGWMPEMKELPGRMAQETVRSAISFLRSRPHGRNAILLIGVGGGVVEDADFTSRSDTAGLMGQGDVEDMREREARETRLALAVGLNQLTEDAALARIPIYGFSIAGLMADGQAAVNTMVPLELRALTFSARAATFGNDLLMTLAGASGGRAVINDNEPTRAVPAIFEENSAYYIVGYRATTPLAHGRARRLSIRVSRPGVTVFPSDRHVWSAKPSAQPAVAAPLLLRAMAVLATRPRSRRRSPAIRSARLGLRRSRPAGARRLSHLHAAKRAHAPRGPGEQDRRSRSSAAGRARLRQEDAVRGRRPPRAERRESPPGRRHLRTATRDADAGRLPAHHRGPARLDHGQARRTLLAALIERLPARHIRPSRQLLRCQFGRY